MARRLIVGLTTVTTLVVPTLPAYSALPDTSADGASFPSGRFPLGARGLPTRTQTTVAPGVRLFHVRYGTSNDGYTVTLLMPNGRDHGTREQAEAAAARVVESGLGMTPVVRRFVRPAVADFPDAEYYAVHIGEWTLKQRAKADKAVVKLKKDGIRAKADYLGDDGLKTTGPWDIRVLTVDPRRFRGSYLASLGRSVAKRETTSAMSRLTKALAGVNGGFFNIHTRRDYQGDPVGISVVGGRLLSEAVAGRSAVILKGRKARVTELATDIDVASATGGRAEVRGVNRAAALDELVVYTAEFGRKTVADGGTEAVVDSSSGTVLRVRPAGGVVPRGTWVLHGTGSAAEWVTAYAPDGGRLRLATKVIDLRTERTVPLTPDTHIVGGSVGLVRNGKVRINAKANGHASINMILRRHPRTLMGVTKSGGLIMATVDGRRPGETVGASMVEAAKLIRWLGARNAVNLDGGGSTAMVVRHKLVNRPSDGAERPVGDAVFIVP